MKLRTLLIPALVILAVVSFCAVLTLLPSTTLYEAKEDSFSENHIDPSIKVLMTTKEADTIFPLMENLINSGGQAIQYLTDHDLRYYTREYSIYKNYLGTYDQNLKTLYLNRTNLNRFSLEAGGLGLGLAFLLRDYERIDELMAERSNNMNNPKVLASINNELLLVAAEVKLAVKTYVDAAYVMIRIGDEYGLDTSPLRRAIELLNTQSIISSPNSLVSRIISGVEYGPSQIYFMINPKYGYYGDTITVSGTAKPETVLQIFCDYTLWGYAYVNENGQFSTDLTIGRISARSHQIILVSDTQFSKSAELIVYPLDTTLNIVLVNPSSSDERTVITGVLKTSTGVPVVGASVSVINAEDGKVLCKGVTDTQGVWSASADLPMGTYNVYAHFYDPEFPLYESRSSAVTFTVIGYQFYIILLILAAGSLGFIIWRAVKKSKAGKQPPSEDKSIDSSSETAEPEDEETPDLDEEEDEELLREMEEFESRSEQNFLSGVPALSSLATISNSEDIWTMYRCVAVSLAEKYNLSFVEAKTPRELLASVENAGGALSQYVSEYEFIRYSGAAVTPDEFSRLKELALSIPEIAEGGKI